MPGKMPKEMPEKMKMAFLENVLSQQRNTHPRIQQTLAHNANPNQPPASPGPV
jgi:hypothetical protein